MKNELRKQFKKLRSEISFKEEKSLKICNNFLNSDTYKQSKIILCYSSVKDEVNTASIIEKALQDGKTLALPRCLNKNGEMNYFAVHSADDLESGCFGILEPKKHCFPITEFSNSVCIVPALSFDKAGYRLGYGGGYYDRFLENYSFISVGLCYNNLVSNALPRDKFDRKVNAVITENEIFFCKGE